MFSTHWLNRPNQSNVQRPVLVFVHGLLGDADDWQACAQHLTDFPCVAIELPAHGDTPIRSGETFTTCCHGLQSSLQNVISTGRPWALVGYSLGSRILMYGLSKQLIDLQGLVAVVLEGGNFGLQDDIAKADRMINDSKWASRFASEPIEQVLRDWYQQSVFSSLNDEQRQKLIERRSHNDGQSIAQMLQATSLGKQPYLLEPLKQLPVPLHYVCGSEDSKFLNIAKHSELAFSQIDNAGHNVHHEQPQAFADVVRKTVTAA
ncbi:2-succinyl-6-hydroxy-2,4-cyclohexadiene-1-carboxylate synthase [Vibrio sp. SCSIO 43136]|uniref:2-succinyl-6-hydroxy-2, 4-cyclohexadiene-1-carboxylate synthase n=1 Tax=Vibrio sp. SCSIO 43136 TaxID=2819101 RepID=UPI002074C96B|nr:2-succinyl-6-hydroxy-2,4-cyclohexadiene-1-carboxylate synthase [Vibrio sp. SCSIO 43136]USD64458.1 2-succinyl-6-hydroxy-2,4-cyclohexadiene-1-carboxylate synthase [Vibrio sp. SCSIO 43136]